MTPRPPREPGACYLGDGRCRFVVWAPRARRVAVRLLQPAERTVPMAAAPDGYHAVTLDGVKPGSRYLFQLDGALERPDPASRSQPDGVHRASAVVDPSFAWQDAEWRGLALEELLIYELHVGTFTPEGTFDAVIPHLERLAELGVTAVELMPVAQFPGARNWGYDGVYPYAAHSAYGGPDGLRRLVDACHRRGLAVVLDVVYNHLGPEGNYLAEFGPYFTDSYLTPWGPALNFDGPDSDEVRRFFIENALFWIEGFHFDALRLDAIHAIRDHSARPFLAELAETVEERTRESKRRVYLIAESDLNDVRVIRPHERGGFGLDAQWSDDFHHALHTLLTREDDGYYGDFGRAADLATAHSEGFVYSGQRSVFRRRRHGSSSRDVEARQLVVCAQNHDQVGNRMLGERLGALVDLEGLKLAAGVVLLSPFLPLLFMGEEYGEPAPFLYFVSHSDPALVEAVRAGRAEEFRSFACRGQPPDPQAESSFERSKLAHDLCEQGRHAQLYAFYRELIGLRRSHPALARLDKQTMAVGSSESPTLLWHRRSAARLEALTLAHFGETSAEVSLELPAAEWLRRLDSADVRWGGPGASSPEQLRSTGRVSLRLPPRSLVVYDRQELKA